MHGHAVCFGVEGCDQSRHLDLRALPKKMQRPGAVFTAAPRQGNLHHIRPRVIRRNLALVAVRSVANEFILLVSPS